MTSARAHRSRWLVVSSLLLVLGACATAPTSPTPAASPGPSGASPTPAEPTPIEPTPVEPLPSGGMTDLEGIDWMATSVAGMTPDHAVAPTIRFDGNRIGGLAGCNHYGATAIVDGGRIALGEEFTLTLMLCNGPVVEFESAFLRALRSAETIEIVEGELIIAGPGGELRFIRGFGN